MSLATLDRENWLTAQGEAKLLGIGCYRLQRRCPALKIRVREVPGRMGRLYNKSDVVDAVKRMEAAELAQIAGTGQPRESGRIEKARTATP